MPSKKKKNCVCMYKMVNMKAETWNKAGVAAIKIHGNDNVDKTVLLFLYISDLGKRFSCKNIYDLIDKEIKGKYRVEKMNELTKQQIGKFKIDRARLIKDSKHSMYVNEDIAISIIMQSRLSNSKMIKFRSDFRINPDVEGFDIFLEISELQHYITQSNKEKQKSKIRKELLNYISSISKPLKHIRYFVKKILPTL